MINNLEITCIPSDYDVIRFSFEHGIELEISKKITEESKIGFDKVLRVFEVFKKYKETKRISNNKDKEGIIEEEGKYAIPQESDIYSFSLDFLLSIEKLYEKYQDGCFSNFIYKSFYSDTVDDFDLDSLFDDPIYFPNDTIVPFYTKSKMLTINPFKEFLEFYSYIMNSILIFLDKQDKNIQERALAFAYKHNLPEYMFSQDFTENNIIDIKEELEAIDKLFPLRDQEYLEVYYELYKFLNGFRFLKSEETKNSKENIQQEELNEIWEFLNIIDLIDEDLLAIDLFGNFYHKEGYDFIFKNKIKLRPDIVYKKNDEFYIVDFKFKKKEELSEAKDIAKQLVYYEMFQKKHDKEAKLKFILPINQANNGETHNESASKQSHNQEITSISIEYKNFLELVEKASTEVSKIKIKICDNQEYKSYSNDPNNYNSNNQENSNKIDYKIDYEDIKKYINIEKLSSIIEIYSTDVKIKIDSAYIIDMLFTDDPLKLKNLIQKLISSIMPWMKNLF